MGKAHSSANKIEAIKKLTNIEECDINTLVRFLMVEASEDGLLSRDDFLDRFAALIEANLQGSQPEGTDLGHAPELLHFLFDLFDTDQNGVVDISELCSGLSVLCGGSREDKIQAAFALFDENGDGFISKAEMTSYLTSVYKVLYETSPETRESMSVSAQDLAAITAEQCFQEAKAETHISFHEFKARLFC